MKILKILILFFILLFPVVVYVFLQGFGENQFDIPIYYDEGIDTTLLDCGRFQYSEQYYAPTMHSIDTSSSIQSELEEGVVLYDLYNVRNGNSKMARNNILSFLNKYKDEKRVSILSLSTIDSFDKTQLPDYKNLNVISVNSLFRDYFGKCNLIMNDPSPYTLVLVDAKRRIRGYFDAVHLEEIDRLNTELYILLEGKYE